MGQKQIVQLNPGESVELSFGQWVSIEGAWHIKLDGLQESFQVIMPPPGWYGVISGQIRDSVSEVTLGGVLVEVLDTDVSFVSQESNGKYFCENIYCNSYPLQGQSCSYRVRFSHPDYYTQEVDVVMPYASVELNVELVALIPPTPPQIIADIRALAFYTTWYMPEYDRWGSKIAEEMNSGIIPHIPWVYIKNYTWDIFKVNPGDVRCIATFPSGKTINMQNWGTLRIAGSKKGRLPVNESPDSWMQADERGWYLYDVELWHEGELVDTKHYEFHHNPY